MQDLSLMVTELSFFNPISFSMQVKRTLKNFSEDNLALPANHLESVLFDDDLFGDRKLFVITPLSVVEFFIMNYDAKVECFFNFGCV